LKIHKNLDAFFEEAGSKEMVFLTSYGERSFRQIPFQENIFLLFGKEYTGLDKNLIMSKVNRSFKIPLYSNKVRSLNIANAVGIVLYEGLRHVDQYA